MSEDLVLKVITKIILAAMASTTEENQQSSILTAAGSSVANPQSSITNCKRIKNAVKSITAFVLNSESTTK